MDIRTAYTDRVNGDPHHPWTDMAWQINFAQSKFTLTFEDEGYWQVGIQVFKGAYGLGYPMDLLQHRP